MNNSFTDYGADWFAGKIGVIFPLESIVLGLPKVTPERLNVSVNCAYAAAASLSVTKNSLPVKSDDANFIGAAP